jgi:hypothetical protein
MSTSADARGRAAELGYAYYLPCVLLCASMTMISVLAGIELHQQYEKPGPGQDCGRMAGPGSPRLSAELDNLPENVRKWKNIICHCTMNKHKSRQTLTLYGDTLPTSFIYTFPVCFCTAVSL